MHPHRNQPASVIWDSCLSSHLPVQHVKGFNTGIDVQTWTTANTLAYPTSYIPRLQSSHVGAQPHWAPSDPLVSTCGQQSLCNIPALNPTTAGAGRHYDQGNFPELGRDYGVSVSTEPYGFGASTASIDAVSRNYKPHVLDMHQPPIEANTTARIPTYPDSSFATNEVPEEASQTQAMSDASLMAATTSEVRYREVYASLDHAEACNSGKIRVRRPSGVRWNETMHCAYVSPITGCRCGIRLNQGPDSERHLRTVHLRQEVWTFSAP
ncbi:unnamed protein product [Rhizoctonia solani]|uniref:Uncharacterized protein n=1 Tax=Rhizoctonia solani TaxID=456999 RepID=A0A8H3GFX0_9AGAM|nr:unnamed protein product [Rhizoctonia solani]